MKIESKDPAAELSLNLAPMIDVVFLLLIFFMVATTFAEKTKTLEVDLPTAESGETSSEPMEEVVVDLAKDGLIRIAGEIVDDERMREIFARAARANPDTPVQIRGDRASELQSVTSVMDACAGAGLGNIGIMAVDPR